MNYYDDSSFSYPDFWRGRNYEHQAEVKAVKKLTQGLKVQRAVDIGGGYGRLTRLLLPLADEVILIEPSATQRRLARDYVDESVSIREGDSEETRLNDASCDLVTMIRVSHHIPNLEKTFSEVSRILRPGGLFLLEFANSYNFKSRLQNWFKRAAIPKQPVDRRIATVGKNGIAFVNHYPDSIFELLERTGLEIQKTLSVSNFRSPFLKKVFPLNFLLFLEGSVQKPLASIFFGPSIFLLARKRL